MATEKDIDYLMDNWYQAKQEISELEKKCEKYKRLANKIMNSQETNKLYNSDYSLSRRDMTRSTLTKKDVPIDIWDKYSKECTYSSFYLTKRK